MALRILVVNDDGIDAPGLRNLVDWATSISSDVTVAAPKEQQSGKSHSINIHSPYEIRKVEYEGVKEAYAVDSSPADCVRFAFAVLGRFDLVLSGVNNGYNVGEDIAYSGTCGAIFEASYAKAKAIAFSTNFNSFEDFPSNIAQIWEFFGKHRLLEKGNLWNVNIPTLPLGIKVTRQGGPYYQDWFRTEDGILYHEEGHSVYTESDARLNYDTDAILRDNLISITPLCTARTDEEAFSLTGGLKD